jgi:hypothetical protein
MTIIPSSIYVLIGFEGFGVGLDIYVLFNQFSRVGAWYEPKRFDEKAVFTIPVKIVKCFNKGFFTSHFYPAGPAGAYSHRYDFFCCIIAPYHKG